MSNVDDRSWNNVFSSRGPLIVANRHLSGQGEITITGNLLKGGRRRMDALEYSERKDDGTVVPQYSISFGKLAWDRYRVVSDLLSKVMGPDLYARNRPWPHDDRKPLYDGFSDNVDAKFKNDSDVYRLYEVLACIMFDYLEKEFLFKANSEDAWARTSATNFYFNLGDNSLGSMVRVDRIALGWQIGSCYESQDYDNTEWGFYLPVHLSDSREQDVSWFWGSNHYFSEKKTLDLQLTNQQWAEFREHHAALLQHYSSPHENNEGYAQSSLALYRLLREAAGDQLGKLPEHDK
jgi:hypothetical protein